MKWYDWIVFFAAWALPVVLWLVRRRQLRARARGVTGSVEPNWKASETTDDGTLRWKRGGHA